MKFDKTSIKEDEDFGFDDELPLEDDSSVELEMAEVEVVLAEPTRMVDADGSVVLAEPGDVVTIQSESLKRIKKEL